MGYNIMAGQIVNISNDEAIAEVALKCGDPFFKDFPRGVYSQAVYRAERGIAKLYGIMDRVWTYTNTAGTSPINITPLNFNGAWRITVTPDDGSEQNYTEMKIEEVLDNADSSTAASNYYYSIIFNANQHTLHYTWPTADDEVTIYYTSSIAGEDDYEELDDEGNVQAIPVLPNKYFEEVLRQAVRYMAKVGLATYDGVKGEKYSKVLQIYTRRRDEVEERHLERSRPWIEIKPWTWW
jgi:hypothetical protein